MKLSFTLLSSSNETTDTYDIDLYNDDTIEQVKYKLSK